MFVERERERERGMTKEMIIELIKDDIEARVIINGESTTEKTKFASLLASKDRDYLLSPNGNQVLLHIYTNFYIINIQHLQN